MPEVIGLVPTAGQATRIAPLPCSKELYPLGFRPADGGRSVRAKVVGHYLLEKMRFAGITKAYIVLGKGKWDIPNYFGNGLMVDMNLAYLTLISSFGTPYTLDEAYPFVRSSIVAFGFPDILFEPDDAFVQLLAQQLSSNACATLGLFPAEKPQNVDMVDFAPNGRVRRIFTKPRHTELSHSWCIGVWTPVFTEFLHTYISAHRQPAVVTSEVSIGEVIQAAVAAGLLIEAIPLSEKSYLDIGTAEDLVRAVQRYAFC
jgi:glucose-1-phosphate thymidylyltransferase